MGKLVRNALKIAKKIDPVGAFVAKVDNQVVRGIGEELGVLTPEKVKKAAREQERLAAESAALAQQSAENLQKNQLVDLTDASNTPDVVAGGTANQLGVSDMRKKRAPGLATQLGVRI